MQEVARFFLEKESGRKTSARNSFFGKISRIKKGDIQARVEMVTLGGDRVTTVITNDSLARLGLKVGQIDHGRGQSSLGGVCRKGTRNPSVRRKTGLRGLSPGLPGVGSLLSMWCRLLTGCSSVPWCPATISRRLDLQPNEPVWALFNCFAVVLHLD